MRIKFSFSSSRTITGNLRSWRKDGSNFLSFFRRQDSKNFFKEGVKILYLSTNIPECDCEHFPKLKIVTKKPVSPSQSEIDANKRSRSAKLRVVERI